MVQNENKKVAIFFDAENTSPTHCKFILDEAREYGDVIIKRVYADWSNERVKGWIKNVNDYALKPEQQFSPVSGKNSSDFCLNVDVLKVLFENNVDVFCLASSDSDFTRLVQELRERGKVVLGFGKTGAVEVYVRSFSEFIYLDEKPQGQSGKLPLDRKKMLNAIIDKLIDTRNGKALYSEIDKEMRNRAADFIPKNYNTKSMTDFIRTYVVPDGDFDAKVDPDGSTRYLVRREKK